MFFNRPDPAPKAGSAVKPSSSGNAAEARAEEFLQRQGLVTRSKNYRSQQGEIDLVMMHKEDIVFVEVRLRSHRQFATATESVTPGKQRKIIQTAQGYLQQYQLTEKANCRFDVIAFSDSHGDPEWIQNAFSAY